MAHAWQLRTGDPAVQHRPRRRQLPQRHLADLRSPATLLPTMPWPTSLNSVSPLGTDHVDHPEPGVQREPEDQPVLHQRQAVQRDPGHLRREAGYHRGMGDQEHGSRAPSTSMSTTSRSWRSTASPTLPAEAGCRAVAVSRRGQDPDTLRPLRRNHRVHCMRTRTTA